MGGQTSWLELSHPLVNGALMGELESENWQLKNSRT